MRRTVDVSLLKSGDKVKVKKLLTKTFTGEVRSVIKQEFLDDWGIDQEFYFVNLRLENGELINVDSRKFFKYEIIALV